MIELREGNTRVILDGYLIHLSRKSSVFNRDLPTQEFQDWMNQNVGSYAKNVVAYTHHQMGWMLFHSNLKADNMALVIRNSQKALLVKLTWGGS